MRWLRRILGSDRPRHRPHGGKVTALLDQVGYRPYADDGSQTASTALSTENFSSWECALDTNYQIRFAVEETAGGALNNETFQLEYDYDATGSGYTGSWTSVTASSSYCRIASSSSYITDGENISSGDHRLTNGSGTAQDGECEIGDGLTDNVSFNGSDHTEILFVVQFRSADTWQKIKLRVNPTATTEANMSYTAAMGDITRPAGGTTLNATAATASFSAQTATLTPGGVTLTATAASASFSVQTAAIQAAATLTAVAASILFSTTSASLVPGAVTLTATAASASFDATGATLVPGGVTLQATAASVTFSAQTATITASRTLDATAASIVFNAETAELQASGGPQTLNATAASVSFDTGTAHVQCTVTVDVMDTLGADQSHTGYHTANLVIEPDAVQVPLGDVGKYTTSYWAFLAFDVDDYVPASATIHEARLKVTPDETDTATEITRIEVIPKAAPWDLDPANTVLPVGMADTSGQIQATDLSTCFAHITDYDLNVDFDLSDAHGHSLWGYTWRCGLSGKNLLYAFHYIQRKGTPGSGNIRSKVYSVTARTSPYYVGTYYELGSLLATSDWKAFDSIPTTMGMRSFTFSGGEQIALTNGQMYASVIEADFTLVENSVTLRVRYFAPTHDAVVGGFTPSDVQALYGYSSGLPGVQGIGLSKAWNSRTYPLAPPENRGGPAAASTGTFSLGNWTVDTERSQGTSPADVVTNLNWVLQTYVKSADYPHPLVLRWIPEDTSDPNAWREFYAREHATGQAARLEIVFTNPGQPQDYTLRAGPANIKFDTGEARLIYDQTLTVTTAASASFSAQTATLVPGNVTLQATAASASFDTQTATVVPGGVTLTATAASAVFNAETATLQTAGSPQTLDATAASLSFSAQTATLSASKTLQATAASFTLGTETATLVPGGVSLAAPADAIVFDTATATLQQAGSPQTLNATAATVVFDVGTASLVPGGVTLTATAASASFSAQTATLTASATLTATAASTALDTQTASLVPGGVTLSATAGNVVFDVETAQLFTGGTPQTLNATAASIGLDTQTATLVPGGVTLSATAASMSFSTGTATLIAATTLQATAASVVFDVQTAEIVPGAITLSVASAALARFDAPAATLIATATLQATAASVVFEARTPALQTGPITLTATAASATFDTATGQLVREEDFTLDATAASVSFDTGTATLLWKKKRERGPKPIRAIGLMRRAKAVIERGRRGV